MIAAVGDFRELVLASCTNMRAGPVCQFLQSIWQRMPPGVEQQPALAARWKVHRAQSSELLGEALIDALAARLRRHLRPGTHDPVDVVSLPAP